LVFLFDLQHLSLHLPGSECLTAGDERDLLMIAKAGGLNELVCCVLIEALRRFIE
jgi:hypothetical protein